MRKLMLLILITLYSCADTAYYQNNAQLYNNNFPSANIGSGPIQLHPECVQQFNEYISLQKSGELSTYDFAYSVSTGGTCGWFATEEGLNMAMNISLSECSNVAIENSYPKCKIFAKNRSIVWKWDALPDYLKGGRNMISFTDVEAKIGKGKVELSDEVQYFFDDYINNVKNGTMEYSVFAISADGKFHNTSYATKDHSDIAKRQATAGCMTANSGNQCYLYAINDEIIWQIY